MRYILSIIFISIFIASEPIAIVAKVRGKAILNGPQNKLKVNSVLRLEDELITSSKSFIRLIFLDDGSIINVYPKSSLLISGVIADRKIQKVLTLNYGTIQSRINRQLSEQFKLITQNSELTCDECAFWAIVTEGIEDKFYKIKNQAVVHNPSISLDMDLSLDSTLYSIQGKDPYLRETTVSEQKLLELLLLDTEELVSENKQVIEKTESDSISIPIHNTLRIKLKNAANEKRELILTYTRE